MKVGINGMGRIGRLALRAALGGMHRPASDPFRSNRLDVVHVNELKGGVEATAHLLEFDSIHGRWREKIGVNDGSSIGIGERRSASPRQPIRPMCRGAISAATWLSNAPANS